MRTQILTALAVMLMAPAFAADKIADEWIVKQWKPLSSVSVDEGKTWKSLDGSGTIVEVPFNTGTEPDYSRNTGTVVHNGKDCIVISDNTGVMPPPDFNVLVARIESLEKRAKGASSRDQFYENRIKLLERFWSDANTQESMVSLFNRLEAQVKELERKVKGMQQQITILHSKKREKISP